MLDGLINCADFRRAARRRLPRTVFDLIDGGAGDELTMRSNRSAIEQVRLVPRGRVDVGDRDVSTTVLGRRVSMPLLLAPCGTARMVHRDGERAVARAAARAGTAYAVSTVTSYPLESVAAAAEDAHLWFQLYPPTDDGACRELLARAAGSGYRALCVTVDGAVLGLRERDRRHRLSVPIRIGPRLVLDGARHPRWSVDFARSGARAMRRAVHDSPRTMRQSGVAVSGTAIPVTYERLRFLREHWRGPLVVKGILNPAEVDALLAVGADGIVVSNHGGRQLDGVPATAEVLPAVVDAVDGRAEVFVDGGFRRGIDVVRALALGARAVLVGRPYLFALACGGEPGVQRLLEMLHGEIDNAFALLGCRSVGDVSRELVWPPRAGGGAACTGPDQMQ